MSTDKILTFRTNTPEQFRLVVRHSGRKRDYDLLYGQKPVSGVQPNALVVLDYLAERAFRIVRRDDILDVVSPNSDSSLIDRYVSDLRDAFVRTEPACPKLIFTHPGKGYELQAAVDVEGDLDSIRAYSVWDGARFLDLLKQVKRGTGPDGDLRISTTGLGPGKEMINFNDLLLVRRLRIKVLYTNPSNEPLIDARLFLRSERENAYERGLREQMDQIGDFRRLARDYSPGARNDVGHAESRSGRGELEFLFSDAMPCGFVAHTLNWAVVGIFLAHTSYTFGPMLEIDSRSPAWSELMDDWRARWQNASTGVPKLYKRG